jgi:hypothetical protein
MMESLIFWADGSQPHTCFFIRLAVALLELVAQGLSLARIEKTISASVRCMCPKPIGQHQPSPELINLFGRGHAV